MAEENLKPNQEDSKKSEASNTQTTIINSSQTVDFKFKSTITVVALIFCTCGIYGLYLIYKWVEIIQAQSEDKGESGLVNPIVAVLASVFTCGIGGLYYNYKIPERAAYITRKTGGNTNPGRKGLKPPMKELPLITLFGGIFWIFIDIIGWFFTASLLIWILLPVELIFWAWVFLSIERSVEYMACIHDPEE